MSEKFEALYEDDVISTSGSSLMFQCTFKVSEFMTILHSKLEEDSLFSEGIDAEVLSPGKQWRKGKMAPTQTSCSMIRKKKPNMEMRCQRPLVFLSPSVTQNRRTTPSKPTQNFSTFG